jgi:hypothetical protein
MREFINLIENAKTGFPLVLRPKLWHIGTLDAANKGTDSYEGAGVSVSLDPMKWAKIARIGITPLWQAEKANGTFLNNKALTDDHRAIMAAWAVEQGLIAPSSGKYGYSCTPAMASKMHVRNPTDTYFLGLVAGAYAEDVLDVDGVWWAVATSAWSAPRGVIVPSKISEWNWTKIKD